MAVRKYRILVVLDTNILVNAWTNPRGTSPSQRVWQMWLARQIQLGVSDLVVAEYVEVLERRGHPDNRIQEFVERLETRPTVTWVNLGRRTILERDPDDEIILATAHAARVDFLITLDHDLLEMTLNERRRFKFEIVTPTQFLEHIV